ncbi:UNVERIFIED_CONTAM: hypothetical protein FKN15_070088 [Acipenser sinensis]
MRHSGDPLAWLLTIFYSCFLREESPGFSTKFLRDTSSADKGELSYRLESSSSYQAQCNEAWPPLETRQVPQKGSGF